jgi:predicted ATPase/DNA-binding CsgD family transcriptional regulator
VSRDLPATSAYGVVEPGGDWREEEALVGEPGAAWSRLVGRERERADVGGLLEDARLVTLVGSGGCGKTRLAAELVRDLAHRFADGAVWVGLAAADEPDVVDLVATATAVGERPGHLLVETIVAKLQDSELLVVLDNCEHVVGACAALVDRLLRGCPHLQVLATSRAPLLLAGEAIYPLEPLPLPAAGARTAVEVGVADAARLFELRARQATAGFALEDGNAEAVAEICRRLDGIPLAIEMAAARARVLAPAQIAALLSDRFRLLASGRRDAPTRQRTLEASIAWSYELLDRDQRLLLSRLSVVAGSFDLEAARAVGGGKGIDDGQVLDLVTALNERSLVQVTIDGEEARYRLLETIRLYARGKLADLEDPAWVRDRHLDFFVGLAKRARAGLAGSTVEAWMARLEVNVADLHAAMQWAVDSGRPLAVLEIAEPTQRFWLDRGRYSELERRLRAAVEAPGATDSDRAQALTTAMLLWAHANAPQAHAFAQQAVPAARAGAEDASLALSLAVRAFSGLTWGLASTEVIAADTEEAEALAAGLDDGADRAYALVWAGVTACYGLSVEKGMRLFQQMVAVCEESEVSFHLPAAHATLGLWLPFRGEVERGREHAREAIRWSRHVDRPGWEAVAFSALAVADLMVGHVAAAREQLADAEALLQARNLTASVYQAAVIRWSAVVACRSGATDEARRFVEAAHRGASARGARMDEAWETWLLGLLATVEGRSDDAAEHLAACHQLSLEPRYPFILGRALLGLSSLDDDPGQAWELAHEALGVLATYGDRIGSTDALEMVAGLAVARDLPEQALRLLAAANRFREQTGIVRLPPQSEDVTRALDAARAHVGADDAEVCRAEGEALSLEDAVAYARRGRGERDRPEMGWGSLSPIQREVVRLVADGFTNAQIGERLFISPNTVKKHLSTVYAKVGADGRAELAAEAGRRAL